MTVRKQPIALLIATNWWPLSARLASALIRSGCGASAVCPRGHPIAAVRGMGEIHLFRGFRFRSTVLAAIAAIRPDLLVPCDDQATWLLHVLHRTEPGLHDLIARSLGDPANYEAIRSRSQTLSIARELGIPVPETASVQSETETVAWFESHPASAVVKLDGSWGGRGVEIVGSSENAAAAYRRLSVPLGLPTALKRQIINSDPAALWAWRQKRRPAITIQELVPGTPANSMILCWRGEVLAELDVEVLCAQSMVGAALVVRTVERAEFQSAGALLAERLKLSGFFGLDFMLDAARRAAYLIEINPRTTQLGHLRVCGRDSLAGVLASRLGGEKTTAVQAAADRSTIAFFPQTLEWDPESSCLQFACHDVPWEEPRLVKMLLGTPWPERRWLYRLYHHFRPAYPTQSVEFHEIGRGPIPAPPSPASAGATAVPEPGRGLA